MTPIPFNVVEHVIDFAVAKTCQHRIVSNEGADGNATQRGWGKHYTWPVSTLGNRMVMARRKQKIRRELVAERRKLDVKMSGGTL
eukprot:SAG11_NODE_3470_length_2429_cov_3.351073_1_plen_85_part_00